MSQQIKKKYLQANSVDGTKIQLANNEAIRAKNFAGSDVDLIKLNASDKISMPSAPIVSAEGSDASSLQTKNQMELAIEVEYDRAIAAEGALQAAINATATNLKWRPSAIAITADADLQAAAEGDTLSALLPFSDDEAPAMVIGDFAVGNYIISSNGASSKLWKVYDDAGTLKLTLLGFDALAVDYTFIVKNDLVDSPAGQENRSIWNFSGTAMVKLGDFDWSLATGIDLSGAYSAVAGTVTVGDSIEAAISKIVGNLAAEITARGIAEGILQDNIDAEAGTRGDADIALQDNIDAEYDRAFAAEGLLDGRITALENAVPSWHKMKISLVAGDVTNGYVDLAHTIVPNSLVAFTGRLAIHLTEDYTTSIVSLKTRLTFVGSMAVGQAEEIADGDDLFFTYQF